MSAQVSLDELIRNLRETSAIGDEQLKNTTRNTVNFIVMMANNAYERRKPKIQVTDKSNGKAPLDNPDLKASKESPQPKSELEYADLEVICKTATPQSEVEAERNRVSAPQGGRGDEEETTTPTIEEKLPNSTQDEEEFSPSRASGETLYKFSDFWETKTSFKPGITGVEAQAIVDLISSSEGSRINNGENLLIKSGNKTLFETDAQGKVIYSANDRDRRFKANRNIPIVNSINDLQQRATSIVRNEQSLRDELDVTRATGIEPPDRQFERMTKSSSMARSSGEAPDATANKQKVDALIEIKDSLDRDGEVRLDNGSTIKAEPIPGREGDGIVQIKMYEVDAPEPVVLGNMDERGNVILSKEYTAPRYAAVSQFVKNEGLANEVPGKAPIVAPTAAVNNQPDSVPNVPPGQSLPAAGVKALTTGQSPNGSKPGVSLKDLINLKNFYTKSPEGKARPESLEAQANFDRYKFQLSQHGKAVSNNPDLKMTNGFFKTFQSDAVELAPADRANLEAANTLAAEQSRIAAQQKQNKPESPTQQRSQTKSVGM
ncbi:hypothetical protein [Chamaesiphon minutus]|uniref:Uncharacterized protein n=1 Tax=Chamaesiphon minutus (strain ATCC 27169 / PCC 6605) TaxID=1173020 RepID=K9UCU9_CHAP6|nr:hypothetical protein [Chamaesiphon minutus]AFY92922.1 hypothetical protein Cha6605_1801 [Chamaesiphon minutus PCC 6605]